MPSANIYWYVCSASVHCTFLCCGISTDTMYSIHNVYHNTSCVLQSMLIYSKCTYEYCTLVMLSIAVMSVIPWNIAPSLLLLHPLDLNICLKSLCLVLHSRAYNLDTLRGSRVISFTLDVLRTSFSIGLTLKNNPIVRLERPRKTVLSAVS